MGGTPSSKLEIPHMGGKTGIKFVICSDLAEKFLGQKVWAKICFLKDWLFN